MKRKQTAITLLLILCLASPLFAAPPVAEIMKTMDNVMELEADISVKAVITDNKVNQGIKIFESLYFRKDKTDEFLIIITAPESDKGNGYLRVEDNFWMYRQNTRTFQHINRDESIMGTDAKEGDFEKRKLCELYKPQLDAQGHEVITEETLGKRPVYKFTLIAKVNDVTYPKVTYWVQKDNFLTLKTQSYSLSGTLMQTAYFPQWTQVQGKYIPIQHIYIDEFEKGNKTIVELSGISLKKLDPKIFTKAYLEFLSK